MFDLETHEIFVSRDVQFFENESPFDIHPPPMLDNDEVDEDFLDDLAQVLVPHDDETDAPSAGPQPTSTHSYPPGS